MKTATYKKKKVTVHHVTEEYAIISKSKDKVKMFCVKLTELTFMLMLLFSCKEEVKPVKVVKTPKEFEEAKQLYPWNCTDAEIEYYESLIELKDKKL